MKEKNEGQNVVREREREKGHANEVENDWKVKRCLV